MSKVYVQIPFKPRKAKILVPCPCCMGAAADARPEHWYHDRKLVRPIQMPLKAKGVLEWQCVICKNRRQVTPAKAMTFILLNL